MTKPNPLFALINSPTNAPTTANELETLNAENMYGHMPGIMKYLTSCNREVL